ncbi:MAG: four helix bundle protein [Bacteroidota bacterium]|nr:four helix bundle protein [Bacteroidota bacterium]
MDQGLGKRLFDFSVNVIKYSRKLPNSKEYDIVKNQLIKSSTSVGANYEESQAGSSKADFNNKVRISLREMRESNYWLRIIEAMEEYSENDELRWLLNESSELKKILGSIVQKTRKD